MDIPEDLLPHAISFIFEFFKNKVNNYKKFQKNNLKTNGFVHFKLKTKIIFDFKENIKAKK